MRKGRYRAGVIYGLISSAFFGMIPLFTLPLLIAGLNVETALVYRFGIAALCMWIIALFGRERLIIGFIPFLKISGLSLFYMFAVLLFFHAFSYLPSGVVATIQFLYPVMVMLIMVFFFGERFILRNAIAIAIAIGGVALLSLGPGDGAAVSRPGHALTGVILTLLAGLANALYVVGVQVVKLPKIDGLVMNFYVMLTGAAFCFANGLITGKLVWIESPREIAIAALLAIFTAVISNLALIFAIRRIGPTLTAILGVMEPLTAVIIGCLVFGEPFTLALALGAALVVASVLIVLLRSGKPA